MTRVVVLVGLVVCAGLAGLAQAGPAGCVALVTTALAVLALAVRLMLPSPGTAAAAAPQVPRRPDFPARHTIAAMVHQSSRNGHHYSVVTRPFLSAIAAALLADRRGLDLNAQAELVGAVFGPEVMALLDPLVIRDRDDRVPLETLTTIVDALERI